MDISTRSCVDSAQDRDYWRALCLCGIEPPGSISHGVNLVSNDGLGDLEKTGSPRDPWFAGSNPADVDKFLQDVKILTL